MPSKSDRSADEIEQNSSPESPSTSAKVPYIKQERKNSASSSDPVSEYQAQDILPINLTNLKSEFRMKEKDIEHNECGKKQDNEVPVCKIGS